MFKRFNPLSTFYILLFITIIFVAIGIRVVSPRWKSINSDGFGYYLYLPQILKYQDIKGTDFLDELSEFELGNVPTRLIPLENGNVLNKYPIGVAMMMTPFFLSADIFNSIFIQSTNYFEGVYSIAVSISSIFYLFLGLFFLGKILKNFFSNKVTFITLFIVVFGTNLLHYSTFDGSFSHVYSFAVFAAFTFLVFEFEKFKKNLIYWVFLGALFGFIAALRQSNIVVGLLLVYPFLSELKLNGLVKLVKTYFLRFIVFIFFALLLFLPQMIYWHSVTGSFLVSSYSYNTYEVFNFSRPEVGNVLFSAKKGLFFWSPLLLLSVFGLLIMLKKRVVQVWSILAILLLQVYIVSSWWAWSYGFSFGHRAFTEFLVFFSIPIGFFFNWLLSLKNKRIIIISLALIGLLVLLNLFQMQQYWRGLLHPDGMTLESYIRIFLQPCIAKIEFLRCDWL